MSAAPMRLAPTPARRAFGVGATVALGLFLIWLGFDADAMAPPWRLALVVAGGVALWGAQRMRRATALAVELTDAGLSDTSGRILARIEDIRSVDRGALAFKPSNGFLVRLHRPAPRAWAPGLWWRFGRSLGVGGAVSRDEARLMADRLGEMLRER